MAQRGRVPEIPTLTSRAMPESVGIVTGPGLSPAGSGGPQLLTLADRLDAVMERRARRDDALAVEAASDAGAQAGTEQPGAQMDDGGELYRRAFNRAALEAGGRRLEITARGELDRIARENPADPVAFETAARAWRDGVTQALPPALATRVSPAIDALAQPLARGIRDQQQRAVVDERLASFQAVLPARFAAVERAALRSATDGAAGADLDREQQILLEDLVALGPRQAFEFDGRQYPADPTRAGALSLVQMTELRNRAADVATMGTARSMFQAGPRTDGWIAEFEQRAERGEIAGLRPDQARRIADEFRRDLAQERSATREAQREARAGLALRIEADRAAIADSGRPVSNITDTELAAAGYDPAAFRAEERTRIQAWQAATDLATMTDPASATALAERFAPGTALFAAAPEVALRVRNLARERGAQIGAAELDRTIADRQAVAVAAAATATQRASTLPSAWRPVVSTAAQETGVPEFLLAALIGQESGGRTGQVSRAGARGIAQVMPDTGANPGFGVQPLPADAVDDPNRAIPWAANYLAALRREFGGNWELALMAYNWGPGNVQRWVDGGRRGPVPQETRDYLRVLLPATAGDPRRAPSIGPIVSAEEARAAGQTPEWAAGVNARATEEVRLAAVRSFAAVATPDDQAAFAPELAIAGDMAAENARVGQAYGQALEQRARRIEQDPAGFALAASPVLQGLGQRLAGGEAAVLPALLDGLEAEQARQGVPVASRRALPKPMADEILASIADAPNAETALDRLTRLTAAAGVERLPVLLGGLKIGAENQEQRRSEIIVAAGLSLRNPTVARQIVRGTFLLRDNPVRNLTGDQVQRDADAVLGSAFAEMPQSQAAMVAAARAVYAAEAHAAGTLGAAYDSARFRAALSRIVPMADHNGARVPLPPGMNADAFGLLLDRLPADALAGARASDGRPFTPEMVARSGTRLHAIGPGRYFVNWNEFQVMDRDGARFVLDLNGRAPGVTERMGRAPGRDSPARAVRRIEGFDAPEDAP